MSRSYCRVACYKELSRTDRKLYNKRNRHRLLANGKQYKKYDDWYDIWRYYDDAENSHPLKFFGPGHYSKRLWPQNADRFTRRIDWRHPYPPIAKWTECNAPFDLTEINFIYGYQSETKLQY